LAGLTVSQIAASGPTCAMLEVGFVAALAGAPLDAPGTADPVVVAPVATVAAPGGVSGVNSPKGFW